MVDERIEMRSVSRICAHLFIVHVTHTVDKCAHVHETERTFGRESRNARKFKFF